MRVPHGIPWTRSDSDPYLMEGYDQKLTEPAVKVNIHVHVSIINY